MPYLGKSPQHGNYSKIDDFSGDFDGSDATHAIASNSIAITPVRPEALIISINGVIQEPVTDYTVSGTNITFTTAPASTDSFFGVVMGEQLAIGTPSDATITAAKLDTAILTGHTDIGGAIADADLFLLDDGAGGTLRKTAASRLKTYAGGAALANDGNNRVVTGTGSGGLNGEANLTFNGSSLVVTGSIDPTGNVVLASGQGIDFAATADSNAGLSSELFDDYEEGIYNPTIVGASSGSFNLSAGYDTLAYTKIGRIVHIQGTLYIASDSSMSGQLRVSLPITPIALADDADSLYGTALLYNHGDGGVENSSMFVTGGTAYATVVNTTDGGTVEVIDESRVDASFGLVLSFNYIA